MITRTLTRKNHLSSEPNWEAQAFRNCLYLLRKYSPPSEGGGDSLQKRLGLPSKEAVEAATAHLRRENWWPTRLGPEGVREFLEAGFVDCTAEDYKRWGLTRNEVAKWARRTPEIVIQTALRMYEGREHGSDRCICYNLAKNAHRFEVI